MVDERAAAFMALGWAKARSQVPGDLQWAAACCTSGSAGAHYYPALVEAFEWGAPLLAITADRPTRLQGVGAPQTVRQPGMFGGFVRGAVDLGDPHADRMAAMVQRVNGLLDQFTLGHFTPGQLTPSGGPISPVGPVHLNVPFDKPLEPEGTTDGVSLGGGTSGLGRSEKVADANHPELLVQLGRELGPVGDVWVVAGPGAVRGAEEVQGVLQACTRWGAVLMAECTSGLRFLGEGRNGILCCDGFPLGGDVPDPDLVIQLGRTPVSSSWDRWVRAHAEVPRVVVGRRRMDPHRSARLRVNASTGTGMALLDAHVSFSPRVDSPMKAALSRAESLHWKSVGAHVVQEVVSALPEGSWLGVGNSLVVRDLDGYCPGSSRRLQVRDQRGAAGIDGLVAGAVGLGESVEDPVTLLLGDVSLFHDVASLGLAARAQKTLVIVVVDNGGGQIFAKLPAGKSPALAPHWDLWRTPVPMDWRRVVEGLGVRYRQVESGESVSDAVHGAHGVPGCTLVHVRVPPTT